MAEVKARPILFSGPMIRAILEPRKTQTRRIVKPQPAMARWCPVVVEGHGGWVDDHGRPLRCPYGQPGDHIWCRETWRTLARWDDHAPYELPVDSPVRYDADGFERANHWREDFRWGKTRVSIHMPRWASRITLEIESVRVERLQDITEEDAIAEGIERVAGYTSTCPWRNYRIGQPGEMSLHCSAPSRSFMTLWESINGEMSWQDNSWVWRIAFKRVEVRQ